MSSAAAQPDAAPAAAAPAANPWVIAVVVALASFMEVLDTTIANVVLNYIAGGMGVSEDEASWVVSVSPQAAIWRSGSAASRFS